MTETRLTLPIFPLPVFLLPQGATRLRIFEPRYLRMVKIAMQENGFAIQYNQGQQNNNALDWASWVEITNFDQDDNGMLMIDVHCKSLVELSHLTTENDNLQFAQIQPLNHWPEQQNDVVTDELASSLLSVFEQTPVLRELYQDKFNHHPNWVISRWLELVPIDSKVKHLFAQAYSFAQAKEFIETIILKNNVTENN